MYTGILNKPSTHLAQKCLPLFRLGRLHLNSGGLCAIRTKALIDYWQIDELLLGELWQ